MWYCDWQRTIHITGLSMGAALRTRGAPLLRAAQGELGNLWLTVAWLSTLPVATHGMDGMQQGGNG